ncbi:MAG: HesA/MoeB/ThiF family protein [Treponema sp.]|nr:HesA/MoeB/ThiF family protein [Treponema sp.]
MFERYINQINIPQIGSEGQEKLGMSSVLVVGAGGLGCPIITYLASAGVGRIGILDSDTVALSNLNRQFLHNTNDIGKLKTDSAKEKISGLNNEIKIETYDIHLNESNAANIFNGYDIVLGAVDSYETRFFINKACVTLSIPYIDGGINGFNGCVLFSNPPDTPCLKCIYPETSAEKKTIGVRNTTGVLGTTAGATGTIQANIALIYLLGLPNPLENKLLLYDGLRINIDHIEIKRNENCPVCN